MHSYNNAPCVLNYVFCVHTHFLYILEVVWNHYPSKFLCEVDPQIQISTNLKLKNYKQLFMTNSTHVYFHVTEYYFVTTMAFYDHYVQVILLYLR